MAPKNRAEYQQLLAHEFLNCLEEKGLEWKRGWDAPGPPQNAVTKAPYHGVNRFYLSMLAAVRGYDDPRWATMAQIIDKDGKYHPGESWRLKKGSKAVYVEYWYVWDPKNKAALPWSEYRKLTPEEQEAYNLRVRYTPVFHADMIEGISPIPRAARDPQETSRTVNHIARGMAVSVSFDGGSQAYYNPMQDAIHLPSAELFHNGYELDATLLHELAHATGHPSRLDRPQGGKFGSPEYAYEELVAEISACFMGAGLEQTPLHVENHKAYVQAWLRDIQDRPETLIAAIRDAQTAAGYMERQAELSMEQARQAAQEECLDEVRSETRDEAWAEARAETAPAPSPPQSEAVPPFAGWSFDGGRAEADGALLLIFFDRKPADGVRGALKEAGFRWDRGRQGWKRALDAAAVDDARRITAPPVPEPSRPAPAEQTKPQQSRAAPVQEKEWSPLTRSGKLRYTEEQYQTARESSALEYARRQGYQLVREGGRYHLKEHDSMIFMPDGRWFWNSRGLRGGAIEFITAYEGRTLPEAVLTLNGVDWSHRGESHRDKSQRDSSRSERKPAPYAPASADLEAARTKAEFVLPPRAERMSRVFSYLCSTRGLDYELVRELVRDRRVYESVNRRPDGTELHNAAFVGFDREGVPRSAFLRGCSQASSFKMEQPGSDKRWPFTIPGRADSGILYIFEGAIDAASHATLHKLAGLDRQAVHRLAQGGSGPVEGVLHALEQWPGVKQVRVCTDSDRAGQELFERLRDGLTRHGFPPKDIMREAVPLGKDWNEYLQIWRRTVEMFRELPATEFAGDPYSEICGRLHFLGGDGGVERTVAYTDRAHFANAAAYHMQRLVPCVAETPEQLAELDRTAARGSEREKAGRAEAREPPGEDAWSGPEPARTGVSGKAESLAASPPQGPRLSIAEQIAWASQKAAQRNAVRQGSAWSQAELN